MVAVILNMNCTNNRTHFDIFNDDGNRHMSSLIDPFVFLPCQKEVSSRLDFSESVSKIDYTRLQNVTKRKKKVEKSEPPGRKKQKVENDCDKINFPPYKLKPHFIPAEVQLSLFKASVIGRNEAENILKNSGIKKCTTRELSSGKLEDQNKIYTPKKTSTRTKKRTTLFSDMACTNKTCVTPDKTLENIENDICEAENYSPFGCQSSLTKNAHSDKINQKLLHTPRMVNSINKNMAPLSGIKKLADTPNTSSPSTPALKPLNARNSPSLQIIDISDTQQIPTFLLNGVVAFVDVRSDSENRSQGVKDVLLSLGAKIQNYFTKKVTVVIFKDGLMSTYKRAKLWNVPMVSILWIEACEKELKTVPPELHPPLNLDKYESALTLDLGSKKKTRKKLGVEATDSPGQTRKKKIEESMKPPSISSKLNGAQKTPFQKKTFKRFGEDRDELSCQTISKEIEELKQPSASTTKKLNLTPKTPHEDSFIQALLTVAEDELKDFLNRPLTQPVDEDSVLDLPLSVRLLHKHVFERRARTSVKETSAIVEENIKKFTDNGRIKLRKLVFPSCEGENEAIKENIDINNGALSNDNEGTVKNLGGKYCIKFPHLAKHGLENDRKSAPAILGSVRSRRSAPAKLVRRRKPNRQKLNFENGNIDKFLVKTAGSGKNLKNNDRTSCDSSQKNVTGINTNQRNVLRNTDENKDKGISDNGENSNFTRPTYLQGVNVENNTQKRKRKLFTLGSNINLNEPVNTSCEPSVVKCPYTDSPLKKKQNSELGNESTSKVFIKPSVPKHKFKENVPPVSSDSENIDSHRRGSSVLFVDDKVKKTNLRVAASIVCTSINRKDLETILAMTNLLGKFSLERMVSERTTHVVTCAARRTINLLKGIARGAWILKDDWIYKSFEAGKWLDEEPFELVEFSSAVKQCRIERIAFGPEFSLELFKDVGFIYVCKGTSPPTADLVELLRICGGKVVTNMNVADIIVGSKAGQKDHDAIHVTEKWILDSITYNKQLIPQVYRQIDCEP